MGHKINESFVNNDNNTLTNDNDFRPFLDFIENSFYFLPFTNKEIINTTLNMKYKSSKYINNWDMKIIKLLLKFYR